jgi:hypothetical protein
MSKKDFKESSNIGTSFILPKKYYDCCYYCDKRYIRKNFKKELYNKRITNVLILTEPNKKIQNKKIKYSKPLFCEKLEGSEYLWEYDSYITYHPYGDVIILTN